MRTFYVVAKVEHDTGENVEDERKTDRQERGVDEKQPDLTDRNIKFFTKVGAYPKRVSFKKSKYPL
jgi:hypothetical protein